MPKELYISERGMDLLERVIRSCPPEMTNGGLEAKKILFNLSRKKDPVKWSDLVATLPVEHFELSIFAHIQSIAEEKSVAEIDDLFIADYFGGSPHIDRVRGFVKYHDFSMTGDLHYEPKFLVSHILLPVQIVDVSEHGFVGVYHGNVDIIMKNLIPYVGESRLIEASATVLCHHSSIISVCSRYEVVDALMKAQFSSETFSSSCLGIKGAVIDHARMISFPWAKQAQKLFR